MSRAEKEKEILEYWDKIDAFNKSVAQRPKDKQYVFYDGPPFATGTPHYGHILGMTSKDLFPRYWTMKGFRCERRWGWDCHGVPIENIAEKELGIKKKKEIYEMGVDKFNEFCRSKVKSFVPHWKETVRTMGKWIEFDNSYATMQNSYMESVWYILKKMYDDGYLYEGKKVLMYCPRCETPLSKMEIAMDNSYKDVTEKTATVKFKVKGAEKTYLLAWTTTPWTLIGNVAIAINEKLMYAYVKQDGDTLILAKDLLAQLGSEYEVIKEVPGKELEGLDYEPLYSAKAEVAGKKGHYVINGGTEVTAEDGTGLVHMAMYGEFDYELIKKYDLPLIQHVGNQGKLIGGPEEWADTWFKKADEKVLTDLKERGLLYADKKYTHPYPFCYRCETPLFYNAVSSWFVNIQKIKKELLSKNEDIHWHPDHLKHGRFKNNVTKAPDWSISRNRFWATSLPIWKSEDGTIVKVIGSVAELRSLATTELPEEVDLHKHKMDPIKLKDPETGQILIRIPEVLDCWFEASSMPYASEHYPFADKDRFNERFPADFISEYVAQVRTWFYYMHAIGVLLMGRAPFKHVVVTGTILAEDGQKMSKSKKNFPDPNLIFEKYGADALRFYLMQSNLMKAQDLNFKESSLNEIYRKVIVILSNVARFYTLFGQGNKDLSSPSTENVLDKWIVSETHKLVKECTNSLDEYDTVVACHSIWNFVDDLSTWYVRRSRDRFKSEDVAVREPALKTFAWVLHTLGKVIAPICPYISEEIQTAFRTCGADVKESIHLEDWPAFDTELIHPIVSEKMKLIREIVSQGLKAREEVKIPVRQALGDATITLKEDEAKDIDDYLSLVCDELNIKKSSIVGGGEMKVVLDTTITPELKREGIARDLTRKINGMRKKMGLTVQDRVTVVLATTDADVKATLEEHGKLVSTAVQADSVTVVDSIEGKEVKISGVDVTIKVDKV
jgi:isoleucyl-tRNA synthetase